MRAKTKAGKKRAPGQKKKKSKRRSKQEPRIRKEAGRCSFWQLTILDNAFIIIKDIEALWELAHKKSNGSCSVYTGRPFLF